MAEIWRLVFEFDVTNNPDLKRRLEQIANPSNHDRMRVTKNIVKNLNSTGDDAISGFGIELVKN